MKGEMVEFCSLDDMRGKQETALRSHLLHVASHSPFYRQLFCEQGIDVHRITLDTLSTIPCTDRATLGEYNDSFLAAPRSRIVDIVFSSGTTGSATTIMYTEDDLLRLARNEEIAFARCGITADDVVLLTCTMDRCFIAGLAYFSGVRKLGAAAIRNGFGSLQSHLEIIRRLRPTVVVGVPSFLLRLGRFLLQEGIDPVLNSVTRIIAIGEPIRDCTMGFLPLGEELERVWGARIYSTYASSETTTSFCECTAQQGGHLHPDLAVVEILDDQGKVLPSGATGEVVVTPLGIQGMPLVRFKTGDISFLQDHPCSCGRNSLRLGPILGRKGEQLKFRGTTLFANAINAVMDILPDVTDYYVAVDSAEELSDRVTVFATVASGTTSARSIMAELQARLRVQPEVVIVDEAELKRNDSVGNPRKVNRFLDLRKKSPALL
jgi:phenylacetate-CoA ligase